MVRTHVLRPTWHFVPAEDLGWLLDVTGPRVWRVTGQQLRSVHRLADGLERVWIVDLTVRVRAGLM